MPFNRLILCRPLLLLPSVLPSIRVFATESVLLFRWPKYWSFSFSICLSNEYSGLISFRTDWFDLLAAQGNLKRLLLMTELFFFIVIVIIIPDILECEVKWALGSITTNKDSGGDGIPVELFQILKHDAVKVLHSICQQIWKTQQ